jgi:hypothetical protein
MTTWRIALISTLIPMTLGASALTGCNDDVDTPPWLPNYTASGYGGAKASAGGASGSAGAAGAAGASSTAEAGEGGVNSGGTSSVAEAGEGGAP